MPTHRDVPDGWEQQARNRSDEMLQAVERARSAREAMAPKTRDQLARARRDRLEAEDRGRRKTSVPPPLDSNAR
jgi:hypothetical protein